MHKYIINPKALYKTPLSHDFDFVLFGVSGVGFPRVPFFPSMAFFRNF